MQYLIYAQDYRDEEALNRRLAVREEHIKLIDRLKAEGKLLFGVVVLNEDQQMVGSMIVGEFAKREELDEWLKIEPYVVGKVWETIEVRPCKIGPSFIPC